VILYKYYGFSAGMAALGSRKLGFRNPVYFNDPFELSNLDNSSDSDFVSKKIDALKESLVILSLTRTAFNPLMWAHYAEDHKGFVIGYDIEDEFFLSGKYNIISANEGDVIYTTEKERIDISDELKETLHNIFHIGQGEEMNSFSKEKLEKIAPILKKALLYKHSCWAYEEEVRVIKVLNSVFEECHVWQSDLNRAFSSLNQLVAPGIGSVIVPGLYLYSKEAKIREVYLGMRNPLLSRHQNVEIKSRSVYELAENLAWSVNKVSMSDGSWGLKSTAISHNFLMVPEQTKGLINSLSFSGREAEYLSKVLPELVGSADDCYELTNWSGELNLKKNGEFIE
jgi:hypothetical protein